MKTVSVIVPCRNEAAHIDAFLAAALAQWLPPGWGLQIVVADGVSDDAAFTESPAGLVRWAPVMDELKELDEEIVRNSIRFRWQEVRREFARHLDSRKLLDAMPDPAGR